MSETKLATKADLKEMYDRMLPYMGGMPEMLANKFSKGDMYSTDEKMIGQWIDGKPLYQKTIVHTLASNITNVNYDIPANLSDIETVAYVGGIIYENGTNINIPLVSSPSSQYNLGIICIGVISASAIQIRLPNQSLQSGTKLLITVQYTKTTDTAISIGSDTDYSTDEKIVGTWIDGKPIYQRTFAIPETQLVAETLTVVTIAENLSINNIVSFDGIYNSGRSNNVNNFISFNYDNEYWCRPLLYENTLRIDTVSKVATTIRGYITIRYTKAT